MKTSLKESLNNLKNKNYPEIAEKISVNLFYPKDEKHGHFSTNLALLIAKEFKQNPKDIAKDIAKKLESKPVIKKHFKVELINGFINFSIKDAGFIKQLVELQKKDFQIKKLDLYKNKKYLIEFCDQNPFKSFHIGHLRTAVIGESLSRLLDFSGAKVIRANYQGDVGLHVAKFFWGFFQIRKKQPDIEEKLKSLDEKINFMTDCYVVGANAYKKDAKAKDKINQLNKKIYQMDREIKKDWQKKRQWSLDKFDKIYERLNTGFDRLFFESEMVKDSLKICEKAYQKGILKKDQGCLIFKGEKYGLNTRVFVNSLGIPTYEAKELALAFKEFQEFGTIDKAIHVVGNEQNNFFKITFLVEKLLDEQLFDDKQFHLSYGMIDVKGIKMSSRLGNIITAESLIDQVKKEISKIISTRKEKLSPKDTETIAEKLAVGAVKYSYLKITPQKNMLFDLKESVKMEGQSGPYLMYSYVRAINILKKVSDQKIDRIKNLKLSEPERKLLFEINKFYDIIEKVSKTYQISDIADYSYKLATKFSNFYDKIPVSRVEDKDLRILRIAIIISFKEVLGKCLDLMGIETVEKM
ncbi:MAG: arginine--tRNA ligase [Candidatus Moranbacteria bacterium]|nr:arginine--tRNA ligase [Candidatus Moranbacteria bacterium]